MYCINSFIKEKSTDKLPYLNILNTVKFKFKATFVQVLSSICFPSHMKQHLVTKWDSMKGLYFLSIFSCFPTVDIHYKHTHFFKGPLKLHFCGYQRPFKILGSVVKIPYSSFFKSSELGFPDSTPDMGLMRIHLPGNGLEGEKILSC